MANVTLAIDDKLLQAARVRAVKEGTSVNEICRQAIEAYAKPKNNRLERYLQLQAEIDALPRPPSATAQQSREQLYERVPAMPPRVSRQKKNTPTKSAKSTVKTKNLASGAIDAVL